MALATQFTWYWAENTRADWIGFIVHDNGCIAVKANNTAQEKPSEGEVVAVGNGARDDSGKVVALEVAKGDRVLFGKWSGTEVKVNVNSSRAD